MPHLNHSLTVRLSTTMLLAVTFWGTLTFSSLVPNNALSGSLRETAFVRAFRETSPSVVNIHGQKTVRTASTNVSGVSSRSFRQVNGMGTGIIIDSNGYLMTNYHVVEDVSEIRVSLYNGETVSAKLFLSDKANDLAILKIDVDEELPVIKFGTSSDLMVGESVIAIGNAFGYEHTLTVGIISALHRDVPLNERQEYRDLIQHSGGINPGNSGGPLLNIDGEMIGVNVAVRVGAQTIAFAIPVDQAIETVTRLIAEHNRTQLSLGMRVSDRTNDRLEIIDLRPAGPAEDAGLKAGDRIVKFGSRRLYSPLDYELAKVGLTSRSRRPISLSVDRDGKVLDVMLSASAPTRRRHFPFVPDDTWETVGLRVEPMNSWVIRRTRGKPFHRFYQGLRVTRVRKGSPAEHHGIVRGDILVGLYGYEITSLEDLKSVIDDANNQKKEDPRIYVIRSNKMLTTDFEF